MFTLAPATNSSIFSQRVFHIDQIWKRKTVHSHLLHKHSLFELGSQSFQSFSLIGSVAFGSIVETMHQYKMHLHEKYLIVRSVSTEISSLLELAASIILSSTSVIFLACNILRSIRMLNDPKKCIKDYYRSRISYMSIVIYGRTTNIHSNICWIYWFKCSLGF